jgi:beta-glucosidase
VHFKEGILVGYRWFDTKNIKPLFAFGYGLSYTTFDLSNIKANNKSYSDSDKINITCNVTNTGDTDGAEVVQVYIGKQNSKVPRAEKELKGFKKTELKKGETKSVSIDIDVAKLAYYDEAISDWNIEKGDYTIYIGTASNNIKKKINITVK